jgi:phosphoribosylaminoimidazolecarboxamide formyltransferase/IMP cyclohydrolase
MLVSSEIVPVRTALISVHDKGGVVDFARGLAGHGVRLLASGGTAAHLKANDIDCESHEELVGTKEMAGGRVKTLHPVVYAAILADRGVPAHMRDLETAKMPPIDLVCTSLYPFEEVIASAGALIEDVVENIDIGGPAMVRAAAKNHAWVGVVTDKSQFDEVLAEIAASGGLSLQTRVRLAREAFVRTCRYDAAIAGWMEDRQNDLEAEGSGRTEGDGTRTGLPRDLLLPLRRRMSLRYGENPHQAAAFYELYGSASLLDEKAILSGKELSFNNLLDLDAAWGLASSLSEPAAVIVKHTNPCGVAIADEVETAYVRALECDPVSAFGGVVAVNRTLDVATAQRISEIFTEVVAAPDFERNAVAKLSSKKSLRIVKMPFGKPPFGLLVKSSLGGFLTQTPDSIEDESSWKVVSRVEPSPEMLDSMRFAWRVCAATKSNSVVIVSDKQAVGIGAGDQSRVGAAERALRQAGERSRGAVAASEAFFPFRDGIDVLAAGGVVAVVQPGGSVRDEEVIQAADEASMAMVFTGHRHFRHG